MIITRDFLEFYRIYSILLIKSINDIYNIYISGSYDISKAAQLIDKLKDEYDHLFFYGNELVFKDLIEEDSLIYQLFCLYNTAISYDFASLSYKFGKLLWDYGDFRDNELNICIINDEINEIFFNLKSSI